MEIVQCDNCGMRVVRRQDGSCPSCGAGGVKLSASATTASPDPEKTSQQSETSLPAGHRGNEPLEMQSDLDAATDDEQVIVTTGHLTYTTQSIRKSLQALRWGALLPWVLVPIGGTLLHLFSVGLIGILITPVRKALSNTKALDERQLQAYRRHANLSVMIGLVPIIAWYLGYLFWEDGFAEFYPWEQKP